MILNVVVGEDNFPVEVPDDVLQDGSEMFDKMDRDMDKGWQIGRFWVDDPDVKQRCQVAADKLLTALHTENKAVITMMAGYIIKRMPGVTHAYVATDGEIQETEFDRQTAN